MFSNRFPPHAAARKISFSIEFLASSKLLNSDWLAESGENIMLPKDIHDILVIYTQWTNAGNIFPLFLLCLFSLSAILINYKLHVVWRMYQAIVQLNFPRKNLQLFPPLITIATFFWILSLNKIKIFHSKDPFTHRFLSFIFTNNISTKVWGDESSKNTRLIFSAALVCQIQFFRLNIILSFSCFTTSFNSCLPCLNL